VAILSPRTRIAEGNGRAFALIAITSGLSAAPGLHNLRSRTLAPFLTGPTNGHSAAAGGPAVSRSRVRAVPENTGQAVPHLGFRNQGATRHRARIARRVDDAARRARQPAAVGQPGKSKAIVPSAAGGGRAGLASGTVVGSPT